MDAFIETGDAEGLRNFIAKASASNINEGSVLEGMVECQVRERAMQLAKVVKDEKNLDEIRKHLAFVADLCKSSIISKGSVILAIQDMMDVSPLSICKRLFGIVEDMMLLFKEVCSYNFLFPFQPPLQESSQVNVLRMCNDLLKRLSRTVETSFCGRILSFLSKFLPLMEKSGLNLPGLFNTHNVTKYETGEAEFTDLLATQDDSMETGEIEESKESLINVDSELYQTFWMLQAFFANPNMCFDANNFTKFQKALSEIVTTLGAHKLEKFRSKEKPEEMPSNASELTQYTEKYFAKYLTSTKLLQLQLNDSQFRRYFLVQVLIIIQYLTSNLKMNKMKNMKLTDEQTKVVNDFQEKCFKLLRDTYPKGYTFMNNIKTILARETEWSEWKNNGCYEMNRHQDKTPMLLYRKRARVEFNPAVIDLGSAELTRLWNIEPNLKKACRDPARRFIPTVEQFIQDPLDELDPEQQVDDEYKSIYNTAFQWRASRFLMTEAESFWNVKNDAKDVTEDVAGFTAKVICTAGGKLDYLTPRVQVNNNNEEQSRSPDSRVCSVEALEQLAQVLSKTAKLDELITSIFPEFEKLENEDDNASFKRLVEQFAESKAHSIPQMANSLLAAHVISEEVTDALNTPGRSIGLSQKVN